MYSSEGTISLRRAIANSSRDDAIRLALKACISATRADAIIRTTIQCACNARSNATAVGNCWLLSSACQGATYATAEITTQKKARPVKMVNAMAMKNPLLLKSELASSEYFPTASNPDNNHGTICHTKKIEIKGAWLNNGCKLLRVPCPAPARAKTITSVRNVNVVVFPRRAPARIPR